MKLKKCILAGVLAASMLCESLFGVALIAPTPVYASTDDLDSTGAAKSYPDLVTTSNVAANDIATSGVDADADDAKGSNIIAEDDKTWISPDVTEVTPQWIQIDLHDQRITVEKIELVFGSEVWGQTYQISTFDSVKNAQHHIVKNVGAAGPNTVVGEEVEKRDTTTKTDTIYRNSAEDPEKIILRRYVRFTFNKTGNTTGSKVSLKKIRIFGTGTQQIYGPTIEVQKPVAGEYPQIADVKAADDGTAKYHTTIADRTTPAATFIKRGSATETWGTRMLLDGVTEVKVPVAEGGTEPELTVDPHEDGVFGFSTDAQTVGTSNKFDVFGHDVKIVSFQLYLEKAPTKTLDILGKGDKFAVQMNANRIYTYMNGEGRNKWNEENFWFENHGGVNSFVGKWLDILVVVDGAGKQRIYVDGVPGVSKEKSSAIPEEHPQDKGVLPFTIGSNLANYTKPSSGNYWDATLPHDVSGTAFTASDGYIARLKFYSNKNYAEMTNGTGTDISDASILSDAFNNGTGEGETANFTIEKLETLVGVNQNDLPAGSAANSTVESEESIAKRKKVYYIITNMLQKEQPTARISLCPYSRQTVWQKYENDTWTDIPATETFPEDLSGKKFRAVTTLYADDGFIFHNDSREVVRDNLNANDASAVTTVNIKEGTKNREMEIMVYYGCTGVEDTAVEDGICHFGDMIVANDTIKVVKEANNENQTVNIGEAHAHIEQLCKRHQDAVAKITYSTTDSEYLEIADEESPVVKVKKSNKATLGYDPARVIVTATLQDENGDTISTGTGENAAPVVITETVDIEIDDPKAEEQVIEAAPAVTIQSPVIGDFPQVADIAFSDNAKHFDDIADRMEPAATLEPLTEDYIRNSNYIKAGADSSENKVSAQPNETWITNYKTDDNYRPSIENINGVIGFNGLGQTPGDTNKFDVFGHDIKLVSFKLYLKQWPKNPNGWYNGTNADGTTMDIYGKGNKYAIQITSQKKLIMYMENENGNWPQETYTADDNFLNKWHNIFMVVDGKGMQRLYVDGQRSTSRNASLPAYAKEQKDDLRKPFTLGYNPESNHPSWYDDIFTKEYGYIADFEFYSDKNYDNIVNGAGTDISEAQILTKEMAKIIDLQALESKYANNLDDIGTILTNLLQERNATACITASPYVAKTNWSQKTSDDTYEPLDKINAEAFTYSSSYRSTTTLTAYDGFVFSNKPEFIASVKAKFSSAGEMDAPDVDVSVGRNEAGEENKVLTITATYGETEEAPCTCELSIVTPPAPVAIEIPAGQAAATGTLTALTTDDLALDCLKGDHITTKNYSVVYGIAAGSEDIIDFDVDTMTITAKKAGEATITVTAKLMQEDDKDTPYLNGEGEEVTATANVKVTITRADAASDSEKSELTTAINDAAGDYPDSVADDYQQEAWDELQAAIAEARGLAASGNKDATSAQIAASKKRIEDAIEALEKAKSPKGIAKDALKAVLDNAELKALIEGNNSDKKYTADSFGKLKTAYENAANQLATADAATLGTLKTTLEAAWKTGLVLATTGGGTGENTGVKDGDVLPGADGSQYKVASAKDKTVIITKGVDAKKVTVGPTVALKGETYRVIGIGNNAFAGLKKATKVIINANVESIGDQAFAKSKKLKNVTIGANVTKIGKKAFFNCPKLNKVILKGTGLNNKSFGKQAFKKTAKKVAVKWGKVKGKQRTQLKKALKKAGMKVK